VVGEDSPDVVTDEAPVNESDEPTRCHRLGPPTLWTRMMIRIY
jgi:hypothetical protein